MAVYLSIESNLPQLAALFARAPQICDEELTRSVTEAVMLLEREVTEGTPRGATNTLRNQITAVLPTIDPLASAVVGLVVGTAPHTIAVEMGTRPHFVPIAPLVDWVKAKLGIDGKDGKSIAYAISRKISQKGTKGAFMFKNAVSSNERQVQQVLEAALPRIMQRMTVEGL